MAQAPVAVALQVLITARRQHSQAIVVLEVLVMARTVRMVEITGRSQAAAAIHGSPLVVVARAVVDAVMGYLGMPPPAAKARPVRAAARKAGAA